jgi:hypothetical protein
MFAFICARAAAPRAEAACGGLLKKQPYFQPFLLLLFGLSNRNGVILDVIFDITGQHLIRTTSGRRPE